MNKIIIHNNSSWNDYLAIQLVSMVIKEGFISGENQYCWVTAFDQLDVTVFARKTRGTTHTFEVRDIE